MNRYQNTFLLNKKTFYEKQAIANEFNNFFVNVGPKLAKKIPASKKSPHIWKILNVQ